MGDKPTLYIIAGCNGAGKTTASYTVLPVILKCREFVNADEIAKGLSPFNPEEVAIQAGKLMLQRIDELIDQKKTFAIETTLATRSYKNLISAAHQNNYTVVLIFFWLPTISLAKLRVATRVAMGGHNILPEVIERRYILGINNLFNIFAPIVDSWMLYDNENQPKLIATNNFILDTEKYNRVYAYVR